MANNKTFTTEEFIKEIEQKLSKIESDPGIENVGEVLFVGDGIIKASGL